MYIIEEILVSEELTKSYFCCDLSKCKGACCVEGDFGAPLEVDEIGSIKRDLAEIMKFLPSDRVEKIKQSGFSKYYKHFDGEGTMLLDNGACVFSTYDNQGMLKCGIEQAAEAGSINTHKPISCHLYPVRVVSDKQTGFEALNYDRWDICSGGCTLGKELAMPLYVFVKDALIRKYGHEFYNALNAVAVRESEE